MKISQNFVAFSEYMNLQSRDKSRSVIFSTEIFNSDDNKFAFVADEENYIVY